MNLILLLVVYVCTNHFQWLCLCKQSIPHFLTTFKKRSALLSDNGKFGLTLYSFGRILSDVRPLYPPLGTPTLFLTFSCAEYDCEDIAHYLRKVNEQPSTYPISKLCVEDAISVSRVFSLKFHAFFNLVILLCRISNGQ